MCKVNVNFALLPFIDYMSLLQYRHQISKAFSLHEFGGDMTMDDSVPMCQGAHNSPRWNGSSVCQKQKIVISTYSIKYLYESIYIL